MYILTFQRSRSKYFEKGLRLARRLGGVWDGETLELKIPDDELLKAYDKLLPLFSIVQHWSSLKASYNAASVNPYGFILAMHFIRECAEKREDDEEHCWTGLGGKAWSCKLINNVMYAVFGDGQYRSNIKYWYNFGRFDKDNSWVIDKKRLYQHLMDYAREGGITLCPYFSEPDVKEAVDELPERIMADDPSFRLYCETDYFKGKKIEVPVNIRHVPDEKYPPRPKMKYDPDAGPIIWHHRRKNEPDKKPDPFWKRFSKN